MKCKSCESEIFDETDNRGKYYCPKCGAISPSRTYTVSPNSEEGSVGDSDLICSNCQKKFKESDAEDFEKFCCADYEAEYGTDIDSDEKEEYFQNKKDDADLENAMQEHFEEKYEVNK